VAALRQLTRGLGRVYTGDTGFLLHQEPDELVSPDVAYVRRDRLPPPAERVSFLRVVPDLAVEIRSPSETDADVNAKLDLYLRAGVRRVWLVDPRQQTVDVDVVRPSPAGPAQTRQLQADAGDVLEASDPLPGFRLALRDVFS
jgi:Uma2 family endonuclease